MAEFLASLDRWLLTRMTRVVRYVDRYFLPSGKHRPERIWQG